MSFCDCETVIAGAIVSKTSAYQQLALYVNKNCGSDWNSEQAMARYKGQLVIYITKKQAFADKSGGKFCLTLEEVNAGMTIEEKRNSKCDNYERWDLLFGGRQNVTPSCVSHADDDEEANNDYYCEPNENNENDSIFQEDHDGQFSYGGND